MHSYAGFMLAVHAAGWMQPPLTYRLPRSSYLARGAVSSHVRGCWLQCTAIKASCLQCTRRAGCSHRLLTVCLAALTWLGAPSARTCVAVGFNAQPHRLHACSARGELDAPAAYLLSASQLLLGSGRRQLAHAWLSASAHSYTGVMLAVQSLVTYLLCLAVSVTRGAIDVL